MEKNLEVNNIFYDIVMCLRIDFGFEDEVKLEVKDNILYHLRPPWGHSPTDYSAYGNIEVMKIYTSLYNHLEDMFLTKNSINDKLSRPDCNSDINRRILPWAPMGPEHILEKYLIYKGLEIRDIKIKMDFCGTGGRKWDLCSIHQDSIEKSQIKWSLTSKYILYIMSSIIFIIIFTKFYKRYKKTLKYNYNFPEYLFFYYKPNKKKQYK